MPKLDPEAPRQPPDDLFVQLDSERLILRRFRPADAPAFAAYRSDPDIARYQSWDTPYSLTRAEDFIGSMLTDHPDTPGSWFQFAVVSRADQVLVGDCAAAPNLDDWRQVEIGYTLARQHQGRGYATEAVRRLMSYWFDERLKHRVTATCDDRNLPSASLLERLNFRNEGRCVESTWAKGEWTNDLLFAVLDREWAASSALSPEIDT